MCDNFTLLSHYVRYGGYLTCVSRGLPDLEAMVGALEAFNNLKMAPRTARPWKQTLSAMVDLDSNLVFYHDDVRMLRFTLAKVALVYQQDTEVLFAVPQADEPSLFAVHRVVFRDPKSATHFNREVNYLSHRAQLASSPPSPRARRQSVSLLQRFRLKSVSRSCESLPETCDEPLYDTRTLAGLSKTYSPELPRRQSMDSGCFELDLTSPVAKAGAVPPARPQSVSPPHMRSRRATVSALATLPLTTGGSVDDLRLDSDALDANVLMLVHEDVDVDTCLHLVDWQGAQALLRDQPAGAFLIRTNADREDHVLSVKRDAATKACHVPILKTAEGYVLSGCKRVLADTPTLLVQQLLATQTRVMGTLLSMPVAACDA